MKVDNSSITPSFNARNIGVTFDITLLLKDHVHDLCKRAMFQIKSLSSTRCYIYICLNMLVSAWCIASLHPKLTIATPCLPYCQRNPSRSYSIIQNIASCLVTKLGSEDITPILRKLHWLPVEQRIKFKVLLMVFKCIYDMAPWYLAELITPYTPALNLRSALSCKLVIPCTKSGYGDHVSCHIGHRFRNELPSKLRALEDFKEFIACLNPPFP